MNAETNKTNLPTSASKSLPAQARFEGYRVAAREAGKMSRVKLTDQILRFTTYVDPEGKKSSCPERAFSNFTRSIYAPLGLNKAKAEELLHGRDDFDVHLLNTLSFIEDACAELLKEGMDNEVSRAEIKKAFQTLVSEMADQYHRLLDREYFKKESKH